jgi:hypothetical protein
MGLGLLSIHKRRLETKDIKAFSLRRIQAQSGTSSKGQGLSNRELSVPHGERNRRKELIIGGQFRIF